MSARTLGDLLTRFTPDNGGVRAGDSERVVPFDRKVAPAAARHESVEEKVAEAYRQGERDGQAAAVAEYEARLKEIAALDVQQRSDDRDRWTVEQADVLATALKSGYQELEANLASSLARVLEPLVGKFITREAVNEFVAQLNLLMSDPSNPPVRISGPGDLLVIVRRKLADSPVQVRCVPDESCEVRVVCDQTIVETHLRAWTDRLKAAVQ
jgi:hypothetical protein